MDSHRRVGNARVWRRVPPAPPPYAVVVGATEPPPSPPPPKRYWYGWQTLIADGASVLTMPILFGFGSYVFATPIIHAAHGNYGRAGISLAMRLTPFLLAGLGAVLGCSYGSTESTCTRSVLFGFGIGVVGVSSLDAGSFAFEEQPPPKPDVKLVASFMPLIVPREHGAELMLGATF